VQTLLLLWIARKPRTLIPIGLRPARCLNLQARCQSLRFRSSRPFGKQTLLGSTLVLSKNHVSINDGWHTIEFLSWSMTASEKNHLISEHQLGLIFLLVWSTDPNNPALLLMLYVDDAVMIRNRTSVVELTSLVERIRHSQSEEK